MCLNLNFADIFQCIQFKINKYILIIAIPRFIFLGYALRTSHEKTRQISIDYFFIDHYCHLMPPTVTTVKSVIKAAVNVSKPSCEVPAFRPILTRREFSRHMLVTTSRHKISRKFVQQETGCSMQTEGHT
jgi:hypothetical protein